MHQFFSGEHSITLSETTIMKKCLQILDFQMCQLNALTNNTAQALLDFYGLEPSDPPPLVRRKIIALARHLGLRY